MIIRKSKFIILCMLMHAFPTLHAYDIPGFTPDQIIPFKQTLNSTGGAVTLNLHVFTPPGHQPSDNRPAIVFFFGGGWVDGSASHFHPQCEYLASRGMVAISAEYRVKNLHGTTPQECVKDGKSAIRYVREHAAALGIDPNRIAAGGGSAGGHVAAATGTLTAYEEPGENLAISSKPNALVHLQRRSWTTAPAATATARCRPIGRPSRRCTTSLPPRRQRFFSSAPATRSSRSP